ncbi:gastrula zinc finger protein XlCGF57.1-like [Thalassophryne amazonica]|uniref:gastrula zinc finger protein XlCGF57.1-like n=1 Tax=Thalassophryne amazonica TaxID=390379 RepID=UPI0014711672|nr:gastrula zinc finger protein XlCGF57.1-like [Thalassophryne amazonica]
MQQVLVSEEDILPEQQEWNQNLDLNDSHPPNIKEEQEELWSEDEEKPQSSQFHQSQKDKSTEVEHLSCNSTEHGTLKIEPNGEDCGGSQPAGNSGPCRHLQPHTDDIQQLLVIKEEILSEQKKWNVSVDQEGIKEEQEKLWIAQQRQRLHQLDEDDMTKFTFTSVFVKNENDDGKRQSPLVHQSQSDERTEAEPVASISTVHKTQAEEEHDGGPQRASNSHLNGYLQHNGGCSDNSKAETDDSHDWKKMRDLSSGCNSLKNRNVCVKPSSCSLGEKQLNCSECEKICGHMNFSKPHKEKQGSEQPFNCPIWGKRWRKKSTLDGQMRIHTKEKPFGCPECGKRFGQKDNMTRHLRIHTGEKPFGCSECGKRFIQKGNLTRHMIIHAGEKPLACSECGKRFGQNGDLTRHMIIHTGEKPFGCSACDKRFGQKGDLNKHMRIHAEQNPFGCSECGKRFGYRSSLISHMIIHSGKKPFCCSECGKKFVYRSSLCAHKISHTEKKTFGCSECCKRFGHKSNLITHMKLHTQKKPFGCSECGRRFAQKGNLNTHENSHRKKMAALRVEKFVQKGSVTMKM